ncbi:MAG TPA: hypothetical protein VF487_20195 [Chitinophagaceae bacterium]
MTTNQMIMLLIILSGIGNIILARWAVKERSEANRLKKVVGKLPRAIRRN